MSLPATREVTIRLDAGDATDGTGTGASMDVDSAGEEGQVTHRSEPQPARKQERNMTESPDVAAAAHGAEEGGATHSNSGVLETGGFGFNDGVGLSSRDEAQVPSLFCAALEFSQVGPFQSGASVLWCRKNAQVAGCTHGCSLLCGPCAELFTADLGGMSMLLRRWRLSQSHPTRW